MKETAISLFTFLNNKVVYTISIVLTLFTVYIAFQMIKVVPKPETVPEMVKFLFSNHQGYWKALGYTFSSTILCLLVGFITIIKAIRLYEYFHLIICIIVGLLGLSIFASSFYFFNYSLLLFSAVLVVGGGTLVFMYIYTS